jgi:hypothetical protein
MSSFNLLVGSILKQSSGGSASGGGGGSDVTPTVTGTWSNISDTVTGVGNTGNVTIGGIDTSINLYWVDNASSSIFVRVSINDGTYTLLSEGSSSTVSVSNGDTVKWQIETFQTSTQSGTVTIKNASDGDAQVGNTFTYAVRIS